VIHDLALVGCGLVFAYVLDHWRFRRHMRRLNARSRLRNDARYGRGRQLEEL